MAARDAQEARLFALIAEPDNKGKTLTDAWLDLELVKQVGIPVEGDRDSGMNAISVPG